MKRFILTLLIVFSLLQAQPPEKIRSRSIPLGIAMSALVPGAGQWYAESKVMAAVYLTLEAAFITGNIHFDRLGNRGVEEYEDYADLHWNVTDWIGVYDPVTDPTTHTSTVYVDNRSYSPQIESSYQAMMTDIANGYTHITIQKDYHFYENIGKYEQFKAGWDDWTPGGEDPGDPLNGITPKYSDNQYTYSGMRRTANNFYRIGGYFGTALFFNHFISAIDAGFRIKKLHENGEIGCKLYTAPMIGSSEAIGFQAGIALSF